MSDSALPLLVLVGIAGCGAAPQSRPSDFPAVETAVIQAKDQEAGGPREAVRKIIYRGTLALHVDDFGVAEKKISELIKSSGGYVAQFREDRPYGAQRGGRWTVRIPVPQFDRFMEEAGKLGVAEQREVQAADVSEEFVDLEARLKNKQQLEARLLELVAKRSDEIKDVIAMEAELARVREEVERMQGRLRYLTDRVAMTTIEISAFERRDFRPPEATFAGRIAQTFWQSLDLLRQCAESWVLVIVGLAPWLAVLALILGPFVWLIRRRIKRRPTIVAQAV
ncbi:MAG: DUF4349 domain-containing protein [Planctomycetaceae bacterium]|nr:DUF4349 domain-containing protein [Planctomycetaceae bacterium]